MSRHNTTSTTKNELARELTELSADMRIASKRKAYFGGFDQVYAQHAAELAGAAKTVAGLARAIARKKKK